MPMIRTETRHEGGHLRLILDQPKANVLSIALMRELRQALASVEGLPAIRLVTVEGAGDHFSYGASVEEHRPGAIADALAELHGLVRDLLSCRADRKSVV